MSPVSASCSAMRWKACSTVSPSGMVSEYKHRLAALQQLHDVAHGGAGLDLVFAGLQRAVIAIGADAEPEDARVA